MRTGLTLLHQGTLGGLLALLLLAVSSGPCGAQVFTPDPMESSPDTVDRPPLEEPRPELGEVPSVTPGGAFLRSLAIPGWGHAATGSHFRGAFYIAAHSGSVWMLAKSLAGHREARRFRGEEIRAVRELLQASGVSDPDSVRVLADQDPGVEAWDELIESRSNQVEDWTAATLFILLLQATDAFVAGHLMDHPEPLSLQVGGGPFGRLELGLKWRHRGTLPFSQW